MERGDISNEVVARLLVVWEGLLAIPPEAQEPERFRLFSRARKAGKITDTVNAFTLNQTLAKHIWDVTWRKGYSVDVVTFLPEDHLPAIEVWLDRYDLPIGNVYADTADNLSRRIAYMPNVAAIYDAEPSRRFTYGGKGRLMDPESPDFFGRF